MSVEELRRSNTGQVLGALRALGPATRTDLARHTGLAKATIGAIVVALEQAGLVAETGDVATGGRGRPGRPVALTGTDVLGLGFEINVDYVSTVAVDVSGTVRHAATEPVDDAPLDTLLASARRQVADLRTQGARVVGSTVAVPGLVAADRSTVRWAPNLAIDGLDLSGAVAAATGVPCATDNDANCAARAEVSHGTATGAQDVVYVTGTVGIGAGWISEGRLLRGGTGFAGEVGHLPLGRPDAACGCGRTGCWEASIGLRAMLSATGRGSVDDVAATAGEPATRAALDEIAGLLGRGLATLTALADPRVVVLGGYFARLAPWIVPVAERALTEHLSFADLTTPEIRPSTLGRQAAALGAAEDALAAVLSGQALPTG